MDEDQLKTLKYFCRYRSVGDLLAYRELKALYKVKDPVKTIASLVELGLIVKGQGCYSISKDLLEKIRKLGVKLE
ncbi:MAG: hypothetical protein B7O98_03245 [Zestosphaera tikiterensis]|uniref:ArnR1-like winged helix-turn-helix domain-containing protein n=1 Tax=Zestosphaera tikiterensis TaxID=1973259 RepID=A0A2R7Y8B5_9CREN|nr:MAG: hypothetical protein B7O98_03245 [Zestosphaera tikiterensis]